jgi:phosphohistidine swiveling domain-containing protein
VRTNENRREAVLTKQPQAGEWPSAPAGEANVWDDRQRDFVLELRQVGWSDLDAAGGKGANLGELTRAGLPVPAGFIATTAVYDRFVAFGRLGETIDRALQDGDGAAIRAAFEAAAVPPDVERALLAAYDQLGQGAVAVRSSATAEDLPEAAFAGQQDTFLNVIGPDALLDAVRRCWASLWTDRAIAYRTRLGLDQRTVKLAVVVQRMVPAEAAGVLFTAHPVSGARDAIVIDASPGLGEAVVSGLATPDHVVLRRGRRGWRIAERRLGQREVVVRAIAGGGTERVDGGGRAIPALPDSALRELARLGAEIERHFGRPQDVEWAWAGGKPFIVQARPITALPEPPPRPGRAQRLMAGLVTELLPSRPYPLEATTWAPAVYGFLSRFFGLLGLAVRPFDQLFVETDGVIVRLSGEPPIRATPRVVLAPLRLLRLARRYDAAAWRADPLLAEVQARVRTLEARDLRTLGWHELIATVREALAIPALIWEFRVRYLIRPMLAVARLRLALMLLRRADLLGTLIFTGLETRTLETNRALEALAARVRSDPTLADVFASHPPHELWRALEARPTGRAFLEEVRAFLGEYGHRETGGTLQLSRPTWRDAPEVVLGMLQGLARAEPPPPASRPVWQVARDEMLAHRLLRFRRVRSAFLDLLAEARYFAQLREDTRFYFMLPAPVLRRTLLELGRRLAGIGVLDAPEDVFHLRLNELERIDESWPAAAALRGELRAVMIRRRAKRAELDGIPVVDPRLLGGAEVGGDVLLGGIPGSPGVAEGPVRVVRDSSEFGKLHAGEVLVAPFTNPAWTPLFQRAVAVVVDSGGAASHAAIVAREYGIPAVMATVEGTRRLADGHVVRVDGTAGLVIDTRATSQDR